MSSPIERASRNLTLWDTSIYTNHYPRFQSLMAGALRECNLYRYLTSWWLTNRPCQFGDSNLQPPGCEVDALTTRPPQLVSKSFSLLKDVSIMAKSPVCFCRSSFSEENFKTWICFRHGTLEGGHWDESLHVARQWIFKLQVCKTVLQVEMWEFTSQQDILTWAHFTIKPLLQSMWIP